MPLQSLCIISKPWMNLNWGYGPETPKIGEFLSWVTLKFDGWPWKTIGHLFYAVSSFVHHYIAISEFKKGLQSGNSQLWSKSAMFVSSDLEIWQMTLKNNRAPLLYCFKLCASFQCHGWIQTGVTVRQRPIWVRSDDFLPCDLEIWWMTLKNNRAPLLSNIKPCASFHHHMSIQTGVTVRKPLSWVLAFVTLTFDHWPWNFAWTSLLSFCHSWKFSWWYNDGNIVKRVWQTDRQTDGRTDGLNHS